MITIEFYESEEDGKWRWRAIAANGEIIADGAQGYAREENARKGFEVLQRGLKMTHAIKVTPLS